MEALFTHISFFLTVPSPLKYPLSNEDESSLFKLNAHIGILLVYAFPFNSKISLNKTFIIFEFITAVTLSLCGLTLAPKIFANLCKISQDSFAGSLINTDLIS